MQSGTGTRRESPTKRKFQTYFFFFTPQSFRSGNTHSCKEQKLLSRCGSGREVAYTQFTTYFASYVYVQRLPNPKHVTCALHVQASFFPPPPSSRSVQPQHHTSFPRYLSLVFPWYERESEPPFLCQSSFCVLSRSVCLLAKVMFLFLAVVSCVSLSLFVYGETWRIPWSRGKVCGGNKHTANIFLLPLRGSYF